VLAIAPIFTFADAVPLAVFMMFAGLAWFAMDFLGSAKPRAIERLEEIKNPRLRRNAQSEALMKKSDTMTMMLEKTSSLAKPFQPSNLADLTKTKEQLAHAGFRREGSVGAFYFLKFIFLFFGFFVGGGTVVTLKGFNFNAFIWAAGITGFFFWLPDLTLSYLASTRKKSIFRGLPDALDMMVVCVEAGLGLDQAMRKVSEEMGASYPILAQEFTTTNFHLQMGRPKPDALRDLGARTGVGDLRTLAGVLIQADKFGSSVAQALRVQSDSMRIRRRQLAEEKAAKTAVKLIFPLVIFIFPGIFVILVGPAAITMIREMFPRMNGGG
jgi:tight adherence protein C